MGGRLVVVGLHGLLKAMGIVNPARSGQGIPGHDHHQSLVCGQIAEPQD